MNIVISVANRVATPPSNAAIVCGNSDYTLTFEFDDEWAAETTKIARFVWFSRNKAFSEEITFEGDTVAVPILSNTNAVHVGVYAGNLRTTTPAKIVCEPSILCYGQDANMDHSDVILIKGQIAELVKALSSINADPEAIRNAVTEYLAQNPPKVTETDPTVPAWAKAKTKPTYTAAEVGAVAKTELSSAVNTALAQAKASGEFDGKDGVDGKDGAPGADGKPGADGQDYVLTEADKAEIAELAADLVDVPGSSGNVELDTTLTQSGKAADAKAVGDALNKKLSAVELPNAVNDALAQAKASGEFDGADGKDGQPGKDGEDGYTPVKGVDYFDGQPGKDGEPGTPGADGKDYVLTEADKTEIAELAAELVEVPEGGSGGGSAKALRKISEFTLEEDLTASTWFSVNNDADGSELDLTESLLIIHAKTTGGTGSAYYQAYRQNHQNANYVASGYKVGNDSTLIFHCEAIGYDGENPLYLRTTSTEKANGNGPVAKAVGMYLNNTKKITGMNLQLPQIVLAGTKYEFWGVDR